MPAPALIIGLDSLTGLQSARIFHARGIPVIGLAQNPNHPCCRTRACQQVISAATSGEPLIEALATLAGELDGPAVLFPCTDLSVLTLARHAGDLPSNMAHDLPDLATLETLLDKWRFYHFVLERKLPLPATAFIEQREDAEQAARSLRFPCVLKPAVKTPAWESESSHKVHLTRDRHDFLELFERCIRWSPRLVLQEWIPGSDENLYTSNCYFDRRNQPLIVFVSRKVRQWPLEAGSGSLARAEPNDRVAEHSLGLFGSMDYRGLGYLEMKRHPETGRYLIIEANVGRPTGRSALAEACGVELLYTKYCDNLGLPIPNNLEQPGQSYAWMHLRQDLQASLVLWRRGELGIRQWLRSLRGPRIYALESLSDPAPAFFDLLRVSRRIFRR